ncbi:amidase [Solirubrobacter sp. CPCC 204708]|nr:amidase [Solirubrobacter deserti]
MTAGSLSATQLTKAYLQRIALTNTEGPSINAVRLINPKALEEAAKADAERAAGAVRGPLHGIPVLVKDNLDVAGLPTTAGSVALENSIPDKDSPVVAKLRAAGAVLLGKVNLSEFANFLTNGMPSGYSSLGGQVLNPYNADITPSGSSSGSGAAAAAGLAAITIGTETSGSIVSPSAAQGIVGVRPTIGLVSRTGILPISATQDTAGPMTRSVADAAAELGAIAGKDPEDPATEAAPDTVPDYLAALDPQALAGKRIGVINNTNAQYVAAVAAVQALGATTVQIPTPSAQSTGDILTPEFKRDLNAYLGRLPASAPMKSLADIIAYNNAHPDDALKYGQTQLLASQATDLTDPAQNAAYVIARDTGRANARAAIDTALTTNNLEAILTPSGTMTGLGARAGYPQIVVPAGYSATTRDPVGIAFNGTAFTEAKLLAFAYAYEQATKLRKPPSETNPSLWRCVPGNAYVVSTRACAPSTPANADAVSTIVSGTVPAMLSLTLGRPPTFDPFQPGVEQVYTASTDANVISTAGDASLTVSEPGYLTNGAFRLAQPLQVQIAPNAWNGPVSNDRATITFRQPIGANEPLRTGAYTKTLTFTLSTTSP